MKDNSMRVWCLLSTYIGMTCQLSCCAVQLQVRGLHCPIIIQIGLVITSRVQVFCDSLIMLWRVHFGEINVFNSGLVICGLFNLWRNPWLFFHSSVCLRRIFFFFFKDDNAFYESNNYLCFTWQEQITQIKSDLLSVVNKEVQTLKETISKLTEENQELKQENEKLRNLVVNRKTST